MAPMMITTGVVLFVFSACNLLTAVGDRNPNSAVGGAVIGIVLLVPAVLSLVYGIKRAGRRKA